MPEQNDPNAQPQQSSGWAKTKTGFQVAGKGVGSARSGINNGLSKLDSMSISSKGVSFKKNLSAGNVRYDRDTHVVAPKQDVSHLPPPPRRIPGQAPPPSASKSASSRPIPAPKVTPPPAGARMSPAIPTAPRPGSSGRTVPAPPPVAATRGEAQEEPLPLYTPVANPAPMPATKPKPLFSKPSSVPSMNEATTAMNSAKTMGSLYGKYGNQQPGQKTATPSWSEVKSGASAAQNLHSFHGKYAPGQTTGSTTNSVTNTVTPLAAPKPIVPAAAVATVRAPLATPSPKPPLPRGKPSMGPPKTYCVGLYAFEAQAEGDLSFNVGDRIEVLERTDDPDAWWKGKLNGREGIFPANYCRLETV